MGRVYAIKTEKGFILASISQDIRERKRVEQALQEAEEFARSTLDGLSAHIAIIDQDGTILAVNQAWRDLAGTNGGDGRKTGVGANYLLVNDQAEGANSSEGKPFANGIRAVLSGQIDTFEMEYPCYTMDRERWYIGRVTRFPSSGPVRAVIAHEDVSERKLEEDELRQAHNQLATLLEISQTVVSMLNLDALLTLILMKLARLIGYSGAAVVSLEQNILAVQAYRGPALPVEASLIRVPIVEVKEIRRLITSKQPFFIRDLNDLPHIKSEISAALDLNSQLIGRFRSWLVVPLVVQDIQIGIMVLTHRKVNYYDRSAQRMAQMFSNHAAIAIQNAQLYDRAQASAILEERNRFARELHDSVAQVLYSINLYANATYRALEADKMDVANNHLTELQRLSSEAVSDMRLLIFELRPPVLDEEGLVEAVRSRLESVETRAGIEVDFQVEGEPRLSKNIEAEAYLLIQEALNNILKHAHATRVSVKIICDQNRVLLAIMDNGKGIDSSAFEQGRGLGFRNIRERTRRIGGAFRVETAPDRGTAI